MTPEFVITTFDHLPGARLSLCSQWGNRPFDSVEAAEGEAIRIGGPNAIIRYDRPRSRKGKRK